MALAALHWVHFGPSLKPALAMSSLPFELDTAGIGRKPAYKMKSRQAIPHVLYGAHCAEHAEHP